jgi:hypothetical protein
VLTVENHCSMDVVKAVRDCFTGNRKKCEV